MHKEVCNKWSSCKTCVDTESYGSWIFSFFGKGNLAKYLLTYTEGMPHQDVLPKVRQSAVKKLKQNSYLHVFFKG